MPKNKNIQLTGLNAKHTRKTMNRVVFWKYDSNKMHIIGVLHEYLKSIYAQNKKVKVDKFHSVVFL